MLRITVLAVLLIALTSTLPAQILTGAKWERGRQLYYDKATSETIRPMQRVFFFDEFLGSKLNKIVANENTTALWTTVETNLNAGMDLSADGVPGLASLALDSDNNAERAVLYFGDNECLSIDEGVAGLVMETRVRISVLPTTSVTCVIGLAGADNATPDSIDTNAWFRVSHSDSDAWYYESDDGTTDDDDNDASVAVATASWYILKIDASDEDAVKFYINGNRVGTTVMSALTSTTGKVQPYFAIEKASGAGVGTLLIDYVRVWSER